MKKDEVTIRCVWCNKHIKLIKLVEQAFAGWSKVSCPKCRHVL